VAGAKMDIHDISFTSIPDFDDYAVNPIFTQILILIESLYDVCANPSRKHQICFFSSPQISWISFTASQHSLESDIPAFHTYRTKVVSKLLDCWCGLKTIKCFFVSVPMGFKALGFQVVEPAHR
jgi:hypothetical protein